MERLEPHSPSPRQWEPPRSHGPLDCWFAVSTAKTTPTLLPAYLRAFAATAPSKVPFGPGVARTPGAQDDEEQAVLAAGGLPGAGGRAGGLPGGPDLLRYGGASNPELTRGAELSAGLVCGRQHLCEEMPVGGCKGGLWLESTCGASPATLQALPANQRPPRPAAQRW